MALSETPSIFQGLDYFFSLADGSGINSVLDKGGYWAPGDRIWVDSQLKLQLESLNVKERNFVELMGNAARVVGSIFEKQLEDSHQKRIWPPEVFEESGARRLIDASHGNISVIDPYAILANGLDKSAIPYSQAYEDLLLPLKQLLRKAILENDSLSSKNHSEYFLALQAAFDRDEAKRSDLPDMRVADEKWVGIDSESPILVLAEPAEVYYDPARVALGNYPLIKKWENTVTDLIGVAPWKTFFECRVLLKDESMISREEIETIRSKSRELFKSNQEPEVPVSTEFRRLLLASGNGAHPAKTAKNYPNFEDIRDNIGYKNIIYSNMVEEGVRTLIIPALNTALGVNILEYFSEVQLIRGRALGVLAHEENHPFHRFRDTPLEELKSTADGLMAIYDTGKFLEEDVEVLILTEIGAMLVVHNQLRKAQFYKDINTIQSLEAYGRGDTILMNFLLSSGAISVKGDSGNMQIDFDKFQKSIGDLIQILEQVRSGDILETIPTLYKEFEDERIWDYIRLLPIDKLK